MSPLLSLVIAVLVEEEEDFCVGPLFDQFSWCASAFDSNGKEAAGVGIKTNPQIESSNNGLNGLFW